MREHCGDDPVHRGAKLDAAEQVVALAAGPLPDAVRAVVGYLDEDLPSDREVVTAVLDLSLQLSAD